VPAPRSPLQRLRVQTWYLSLQAGLQAKTHLDTADKLYDRIFDESISPDQCAKWAKGQRCSSTWIRQINHELLNPDPEKFPDDQNQIQEIRDLGTQTTKAYEFGPQGEPLWPAFRLPSSLYHTSLILMPTCDYPSHPPHNGEYNNEKIAMLAIEVAGWMIEAEGFLFATLAKNNDDDASWFHAMSKKEERITNDPSQMLARLEVADKQAEALVEAAEAAKAELEAVGLSADLICRTAYLQFMFLVKRQYPSAKQGYLQQMELAKFAARPPLRLVPKAA